jgi:hypothetical protein
MRSRVRIVPFATSAMWRIRSRGVRASHSADLGPIDAVGLLAGQWRPGKRGREQLADDRRPRFAQGRCTGIDSAQKVRRETHRYPRAHRRATSPVRSIRHRGHSASPRRMSCVPRVSSIPSRSTSSSRSSTDGGFRPSSSVERRHHAQTPAPSDAGPCGGRKARVLGPYVGRWVAQDGLEILDHADSPEEVARWLQRHGRRTRVWKVPGAPAEVGSTASEP